MYSVQSWTSEIKNKKNQKQKYFQHFFVVLWKKKKIFSNFFVCFWPEANKILRIYIYIYIYLKSIWTHAKELSWLNFHILFSSYTCSNPLFGTTVNPLNGQHCPGGSSGGEGAVLGAGASIIGLGTDVGGSVRVPAAFCGVCALKPTSGRFRWVGLCAGF